MKLIDLTLTISPKIPTFPGSPSPQFITWSTIKDDGYNLELLFLSSHTGTHMDAPYHFAKNGLKINQISLSRFIRKATLIKLKKEQNQSISKTDIIKYEEKNGRIKNNSTIIFFTNWQKNIQKNFYFKTNPGLSIAATKYLITKKPNLIGIDSPSIDLGKDTKFSVHGILSRNNVLIVENLCNLEKVPKSNFQFMALPLKLKNATGSLVRALAIM